jgi:Rieske Fe-S protein
VRIDDPEEVTTAPDGRPSDEQPIWRQDFPIDWPQDEYRSRRAFAGFLLLTSLAFVAGHAWIAVLSALRRARGALPILEIAAADELPLGGSRVFEYPGKGDACVLLRIGRDRFVAYDQRCTHLSCPVIPELDKGRFHCPCHEGSFDLESGAPLAGPPRRPLPRVVLDVRNGRVYATGVERIGGRTGARA